MPLRIGDPAEAHQGCAQFFFRLCVVWLDGQNGLKGLDGFVDASQQHFGAAFVAQCLHIPGLGLKRPVK